VDHSRAVSADNPDACFVGVDFGMLSGRALVVRARDGAELGTAVHEYRHGVMDAALAATAAAAAMGGRHEAVYRPDPARADSYDRLYAEYLRLHDYFGRGGNEVMHRLRELRGTGRA
jgi:L-ribulokinase